MTLGGHATSASPETGNDPFKMIEGDLGRLVWDGLYDSRDFFDSFRTMLWRLLVRLRAALFAVLDYKKTS